MSSPTAGRLERAMLWLRRRYGDGPLHLILTVASLGFAGYLVWIVLPAPKSIVILVWIAIAAAVHDLVLWPLYAVMDQLSTWVHHRQRPNHPRVPWINHVRVPVVLSAVMLLISFPLVLRHSEPAYHTATGLTEQPYLAHWLVLTAIAFGASALIYLGRVFRGRVLRNRTGSTPR